MGRQDDEVQSALFATSIYVEVASTTPACYVQEGVVTCTTLGWCMWDMIAISWRSSRMAPWAPTFTLVASRNGSGEQEHTHTSASRGANQVQKHARKITNQHSARLLLGAKITQSSMVRTHLFMATGSPRQRARTTSP